MGHAVIFRAVIEVSRRSRARGVMAGPREIDHGQHAPRFELSSARGAGRDAHRWRRAVWAPHATAAAVVVGGVATPMQAGPSSAPGTWTAHVAGAAAGAPYVYRLATPAGSLDRLDPYGRELTADGSASIVVDPSAYAWQTPVRGGSG